MISPRRLIFCALSVFALSFSIVANAASDTPQRQRKSPDAIRVVCANVRITTKPDIAAGDGWDNRKELARDCLFAQDADIVCFQEFIKEHYDYLAGCFPGYEAVGFMDMTEGSRKPNTIFYSKKRFEKIACDGAFLSPTPEIYHSKFEESGTPRSYTRLHLKDRRTGRELIVWNTHFDHMKQPGRDKQAAALVALIKKYPSDIPQIIVGDLNCDAKTEAIKTIKAGGFTDSYAAMHGPAEPGFTYHAFKGPSHKTTTGKIDFIFANNAFRATAAEIIRDSRGGRHPSDHYFVSAEFEYEKTYSANCAKSHGE